MSARVAVLVSGSGRSLENLVLRSRDGRLPATVELVLSNRKDAFALERARRLQVPAAVLRPRDFAGDEAFAEALYERLARERIDLVVLAGYLARLPLRDEWRGRILNIHPALLPAFGGPGHFGHHVHERVLAAGVKVSGCTVHYVDDEYDAGPIVLQRVVPVFFEDDADALAARVFQAELEALPDAIRLHVEGRLRIEGRRVRVLRT